MEVDKSCLENPLTWHSLFSREDHKTMKQNKLKIQLLWSAFLFTSFSSIFGCGGGETNALTKAVDQTETLGNLRSLNTSLYLYSQDYDEMFPNVATFESLKPLLFPYNKDSSNFTDPNTNLPFAWNGYLNGKPRSITDFTGYATFWVATPIVPNARPVSTFNQTSKLVTDSEWAQLKATSHIP